MRAEPEGDNTVLIGFVDFSELLAQLGLGDVGETRVDDIEDELPSGEEAVGDELARADCYWCVGLY